jgi:competence protein ComEC
MGLTRKNKIEKQTFHLVWIFILACILLYSVHVSYYYFALLLIPIFYLITYKVKIKTIIVGLIVIGVILLIYLLIKQVVVFSFITPTIDKITHFSIRDSVQKFVQNEYDSKTATFINLVLFNIKKGAGYLIYHQMIDLSIVYLIVVSGFHIAILKRIVSYCFKRNLVVGNIVNILLITFYCYLLNFAVSVTRVLIMFVITLIFRKRLSNRFDILGMSGVFSLLLGPSSVFNVGFCMSYLCTAGIIYIYKLEITNFFLEKILINLVAVILSLPFVIEIQHQISLWVVINSFAFSYLFAFIFVYFLLTF